MSHVVAPKDLEVTVVSDAALHLAAKLVEALHRRKPPRVASLAPVRIIPWVTEVPWESLRSDVTCNRELVDGGLDWITTVLGAVTPAAGLAVAKPFRSQPISAFWSGRKDHFLGTVLPALPHFSFVVSHGLYMQFRVCRDLPCEAQRVPNGGVLMLTYDSRTVFLVRHCPTCANVSEPHRPHEEKPPMELTAAEVAMGEEELSKSAATMCAELEPLLPVRRLYRALARVGKAGGLFCSPLPRAVVSATSLAYDIDPARLREYQLAVKACEPPPSEEELRAYEKRGACSGGGFQSAYCQPAFVASYELLAH